MTELDVINVIVRKEGKSADYDVGRIEIGEPGARRAGLPRATLAAVSWGYWWHWLNENGVAVTAVVTAVYAFFTLLLWQVTRRQANLTRRAFEATNRPYLSIRIVWSDIDPTVNDVVEVQALVENVGTIPAEVTRWEVTGRLMNLDQGWDPVEVVEVRTLRGDSVFPRDPYEVKFRFRHPGIVGTPLPLRFEVTLGYRSVGLPEGPTYETVLEGERTPSSHQRTRAT